MSYRPRWDNGSWNVICDVCGRQYKNSELQMRWDGLMVCSGDWEPRQPQDFVHGVADKQAPPFTRPEQSDHFIFGELNQAESIGVAEAYVLKIHRSPSVLNGSAINSSGINK